jgi:putative endonuclease
VTDERRARYRLGLAAEWRAAWALRLKGYRIVDRRFRTPVGEIDLVALKGETLAIVEVKARPSLAAGLEAIAADSYRRIEAAADVWLARHPDLADRVVRFDLVVVLPRRWPRHFPDVFS